MTGLETLNIKRWRNHALPELEGFQWELFAQEPILRRMSNEEYACWINTPSTNKAVCGREEWSAFVIADAYKGEGYNNFFDTLQQCIDFIALNAQLGTF